MQHYLLPLYTTGPQQYTREIQSFYNTKFGGINKYGILIRHRTLGHNMLQLVHLVCRINIKERNVRQELHEIFQLTTSDYSKLEE